MLIGSILIIAGILAIIFRKTIVKQRIDFNKYQFNAKYSSFDIKYGEYIAIVIGILVIIFGLLGLVGIVK